MTYSRKSAGCVRTSVLKDTVPRVEQEAHLRRIRCTRTWRGWTRMRSAQWVIWTRKAARAAA